MFGYATDETEELMPLTCVLAHKLNEKLSENRRNGVMPYLRPDSKTQVTVEYMNDNGACIPKRVHTIVVSTQHSADVTLEQIQKDVREKIVQVMTNTLNNQTERCLQIKLATDVFLFLFFLSVFALLLSPHGYLSFHVRNILNGVGEH